MQAVEFEVNAHNGIIKVPDQYRYIAEGDIKIVILKREYSPETSENRDQKISEMSKLLQVIKAKKIFQTIEDPMEWQNSIRDEWT